MTNKDDKIRLWYKAPWSWGLVFANTNLDEEGRGFEPWGRKKSSFFCGVEGSNGRIEWKDRMKEFN